MNLVLPAPIAFTPLAHTNLQAGLSTSSLSSLASAHSLASSASTSASSASSPVNLSRNFTLEQILAAAQLQNQLSLAQQQQQQQAVNTVKAEMSAAAPSAANPSAAAPFTSTSSSPSSSVGSIGSLPSSPASKSLISASSQPSNDVHKRIRATKNKQKHNESESRRRDRLRTQFNALRHAAECDKKDRIAILAAATDRLKQQNVRVRQYETERELLIQQLNQANIQLSRAQLAAATQAATGVGSVVSMLAGKDGNVGDVGKLAGGAIGWLASLPCAFVGLDGKFLDCNAAFVTLTGHAIDFILSSTIFVLTPQHELTPTFMQLKRLLAGEIDSWESDRSCLTADGNALSVHMTMTVAKSRDGKPEFFTLFFVSKGDVGHGGVTANGMTGNGMTANGMSGAVNGAQQQQQQQSTLQLLQPTGMRPPTSGPMSLLTLPTTSSLSLLSSQQSSLTGHPHVSPLSHHHMAGGGLPLAALQSLPQHRVFDGFQPTYSIQQHM